MKISVLATFMASLILIPSPSTSTELGGYLMLRDEPGAEETFNSYLNGVYKGALLFDAYAHKYMDKPSTSFCDENVVWSSDYPRMLLDKEIHTQTKIGKPYPNDIPLEIVMFQAMRHNLKCK